MSENVCDKGPILQQLVESVSEFKTEQKRIINALIDIAKHQERLVSLADRTTFLSERCNENKQAIDNLYAVQREDEAHTLNNLRNMDLRITSHLLNHPEPDNCKINEALAPGPDGKFDKVQMAVIIALIFFLSTQAYELLKALLDAFSRIGA